MIKNNIPLQIPNKKVNYSPQFRNIVPGKNIEFKKVDERVTKLESKGGGSDGMVSTPVVSINSNIITATCETPDATIFYYTNEADAQLHVYNAPIFANKNLTLTFFARKSGMSDSDNVKVTYVYKQNHFRIYNKDYPEVEVNGLCPDPVEHVLELRFEYQIVSSNSDPDENGWSDWTHVSEMFSPIIIYEGYCLYIRGKGNERLFDKNIGEGFSFRFSNIAYAIGDLCDLLDYNHPLELPDYSFCSLFSNSDVAIDNTNPLTVNAHTVGIRALGDMFQDCDNLEYPPLLPATTLAESCYYEMFLGCFGLTVAPELPATTLAESCYAYMFQSCRSLTQAPELPATTLAESCYSFMFDTCTSLTQAPILPATTLAESCYEGMFYGCGDLTQAPELPATTLVESCYKSMFYGCIYLTQAPELPATTLAESCYENMFQSCRYLTQAPKLPATILAERCYKYMFSGTSLAVAPELPATTLAESCYENMFSSTMLIQAPALPATTLAESCYAYMFFNCRHLTRSPELKATMLVDSCYNSMFYNCTSLQKIIVLAYDWDEQCTTDWVVNVSEMGTFTKKSVNTNISTGSSGIPSGWLVVDVL